MANGIFMSDCGDSTGDLSEWSLASDSVTTTSERRTGSSSVDLGTSGTLSANNVVSDAGRRVSFGYKIVAPDSGFRNQVFAVLTPSAFSVLLDATLHVVIRSGSTDLATSTLTTTAGWQRICISYTITNTTTFTIKVFINGVLFATANSGTLFATGGTTAQFRATSVSSNCYLDDVYIDDGATLDDTGDVHVTRKTPNASGTNNAFDTAVGSATNRWDYVSELPISTSKGWKQAGSSQVIEAYGIQSASQGDVDITGATILGWKAWIYGKGQDVTTGAPKANAINNAKATGTTLTLGPVTVAAGDLIVVCFGDQVGGASPTINDDIGGNTWTALSGPTTNTARLSKWYCVVTNGGSMTVTVTFGSSANARAGALGVWDSPIFGASPLDANVTNANDSTSPYDCPLSGTLAQADELVFGFCSRASNAALSAGASETGIIEAHSSGSGGAGANISVGLTYRKVTATTSTQPQMTGSSVAGVVGTASFKITPIVAGTPKLVDNGSDVAITLSSTPTLYSNHTTSSTYPSNGNTVGMKSSGSVMDTFLYECGIQIAYIPAAPGAIVGRSYIVRQAVNRSSTY
jgi:hypothetical protein